MAVVQNRIFLPAFAALAASPAIAADLQVVAPLPVFTWTGFYVGAHAGLVEARSSVTDVGTILTLGPPHSVNRTGGVFGLQAGYNWQISNLVLGVEGDISLTSARKQSIVAPGSVMTHRANLSSLGSLRGRLGFAIDRTLIYATGGVAFGNLGHSLTDPGTFSGSRGSTAMGWVIGAGIEYAITDRWTARAEFLHTQFPTRTVVSSNPAYAFAFKDSVSQARLGLNYKF